MPEMMGDLCHENYVWNIFPYDAFIAYIGHL